MNPNNHHGHRWDQIVFSAGVLIGALVLGLLAGVVAAILTL